MEEILVMYKPALIWCDCEPRANVWLLTVLPTITWSKLTETYFLLHNDYRHYTTSECNQRLKSLTHLGNCHLLNGKMTAWGDPPLLLAQSLCISSLRLPRSLKPLPDVLWMHAVDGIGIMFMLPDLPWTPQAHLIIWIELMYVFLSAKW